MNKLFRLLFYIGLVFLIASSCDENEIDYFSGEIIEYTCGGTIVRFLGDEIIGEEWINNFSVPETSYENCVLVGNLSEEDYEKQDTIYFSYIKVENFTSGNFCDIGGLPDTKIEILSLK